VGNILLLGKTMADFFYRALNSIELQILYSLGKQLADKQASRGLPNRAIKQADRCFASLLAY